MGAPDAALIGRVVAGRYKVVALLGEGGMGAVYEATNETTGRSVALKIPRAELVRDETFRKRFLREARAASALSHPNVIDVLDVALDRDDTPVMVMELLRGASLADALAGGPLDLTETASYLVPVLDALRLAHERGIVHRDFKPENVYLADQPGGTTVPKLLDFGIAKVAAGSEAEASGTTTGTMLGTPYYMAPEQVGGMRDIDRRADVWAAGAVVYECLSGRRPFRGQNFGQIFTAIIQSTPEPLDALATGVPADVGAAVAAALTKDRDARSGTLDALVAALAPHVAAGVRRATSLELRAARSSVSRSGTPARARSAGSSGATRVAAEAPTLDSADLSRHSGADFAGDTTVAAPASGDISPLAGSISARSAPATLGGAAADAPPRRRRTWPTIAAGVLLVAGVATAAWRLGSPHDAAGPDLPGERERGPDVRRHRDARAAAERRTESERGAGGERPTTRRACCSFRLAAGVVATRDLRRTQAPAYRDRDRSRATDERARRALA